VYSKSKSHCQLAKLKDNDPLKLAPRQCHSGCHNAGPSKNGYKVSNRLLVKGIMSAYLIAPTGHLKSKITKETLYNDLAKAVIYLRAGSIIWIRIVITAGDDKHSAILIIVLGIGKCDR
jgi:hypothetical protein